MKSTGIEWADSTWNPWRGCTKISPGCAHCYAETLSKRNPKVLGQWGKGKPRVLAKNWDEPMKWNRQADLSQQSLTIRRSAIGAKPAPEWIARRPRVFPSLCDWLDDEVPLEWFARFLQLIHDTPYLDWLLLTKRPEQCNRRLIAASHYLAGNRDGRAGTKPTEAAMSSSAMVWDWLHGVHAPQNVWIGTSVENQEYAAKRIPQLLKIPARVRFLSVEPLLGPLDLAPWIVARRTSGHRPDCVPPSAIDWVIIGGESGPCARPCNVDWIRSIVRQCADAAAPCFVKQLGARPVYTAAGGFTEEQAASAILENWEKPGRWITWNSEHNRAPKVTHPKGGAPAEWPEDLRVRQMPEVAR